jgi:hypothetical protein
MFQSSTNPEVDLRHGLGELRGQITELKELLAARRRERICQNVRYQLAALRFETAAIWHAHVCRKAGFDPNEPRVPAGSPQGGQWTRVEGGTPRLVGGSTSPVMSDATPDPIRPGAQYAQTRIKVETSALTGIQSIDDTTMRLAHTLARVKDIVNYTPDLGPAIYGTTMHTTFAAALRLQQIRGLEVESTFGGAYYGAKGSIRPDAVLRNDIGDIVAIYDVKTGEKSIDPARAARLRLSVGAGNDVPVIELSIPYGVRRKAASLELGVRIQIIKFRNVREMY